MPMIKVDQNRCKGCKLCVVSCPRKILEMSKDLNANGDNYCVQVDADKCIACGKCIQSGCPSVVLSDAVHPKTGKRKARIEPVTCVGCGVCSQICPVQAISGPENA